MEIPVLSRKTLKYILAGVVAMVILIVLFVMSRRAQSNYETIPGTGRIDIKSIMMSSSNTLTITTAGMPYRFAPGELVAIFPPPSKAFSMKASTDGTTVMDISYFNGVLPVGTVIAPVKRSTANTFTINGMMTGIFPGIGGNVEPIARMIQKKMEKDMLACMSKPTPKEKEMCIGEAVRPYTIQSIPMPPSPSTGLCPPGKILSPDGKTCVECPVGMMATGDRCVPIINPPGDIVTTQPVPNTPSNTLIIQPMPNV